MKSRVTTVKDAHFALVTRLFKEHRLLERIDTLPEELFPEEGWQPSSRCVTDLRQERLMCRERLLSMLGYVWGEYDAETPLSEYLRRALARTALAEPVFGLSEPCCNHCNEHNFRVTSACEGCMARPCAVNCPKQCIGFGGDGRALIDQDRCIKCGICQRVCPYHAIIRKPIPCVDVCPVGAITNHEGGRKEINRETCINCGKCLHACPFATILPRSNLIDVLRAIDEGKHVVACLAPAIAGYTGRYSVARIAKGLQGVGFAEVVEVAYGADLCAVEESEEFVTRILENHDDFMTTSCCPAYICAIEKHVPELTRNISRTPSPMRLTSRFVKQRNPDAVVVFIGPCNAKRWETLRDEHTDYCLAFDEIFGMMEGCGVRLDELDDYVFAEAAHKEGRLFPVSGGVAAAVASFLPKEYPPDAIKHVVVDGVDPANIKRLQRMAAKPEGNLVEVMVCKGGCVNGPSCPVFEQVGAQARVKVAVDKSQAHPIGGWVDKAAKDIKPLN